MVRDLMGFDDGSTFLLFSLPKGIAPEETWMASLEVGRFVHSWWEWYKLLVSFRTLGSQISVALNLPYHL